MIRQWLKTTTLLGVAAMLVLWGATSVLAKYEGGAPGGASIAGKVTFKGTAPAPKTFAFAKFPQPEFCGKAGGDGKGNRILEEVKVNDGSLQDVVVFIEEIDKGKDFNFKGTDVVSDQCQFLVQGGPSTFVGVVKKKAEFRVKNLDADPNDPKAKDGVLHNPHGYEVKGATNTTLFNKPLPKKDQVVKVKVKLRKKKSAMKVECDQHGYMQVWFQPVENPYYAVVAKDGTFKMDQVPAGKYELVAWHPILGRMEKKVEVGASGEVSTNFEFKSK